MMKPKFLSHSLISLLSFPVFCFLDFLDALLCVAYRFIDSFLEETSSSPCYCCSPGEVQSSLKMAVDGESELSVTLYRRKNVFRRMAVLANGAAGGRSRECDGSGEGRGNRWSDCGCEPCIAWMKKGESGGMADLRLHLVVREPSASAGKLEDPNGNTTENIIFLHGFMGSSSFWTQTVFPYLSENSMQKYRLFAVDLLGFGQSPKPRDCFYTMKDHLEMIEKTVIIPFELKSFHLVAHSMGCVIALALGAKHAQSVKSITLIAPPYFPADAGKDASLSTLEKVAARRIWPPVLFGSAFMSWYEHLGRCVCFIICRNHRTWEWILRKITGRDLHFTLVDMTRHTHHSAWHTMHNVICGGGKMMDKYLEALTSCGVKMKIIHGSEDQVVPLECSEKMKMKAGDAKVKFIAGADHSSVIMGRERDISRDLRQFWASITK
ncbi:unnamed protein product [Cuscuta epithymum]|uniref:AB hydrolase-1 domain-containing protein n=1 Tax=Cuscuta epithymum TaxID=186058 RepID=A0AAV0C5H7_9ASTE|nr:unnamed protein product [Cuscuta epithymum]